MRSDGEQVTRLSLVAVKLVHMPRNTRVALSLGTGHTISSRQVGTAASGLVLLTSSGANESPACEVETNIQCKKMILHSVLYMKRVVQYSLPQEIVDHLTMPSEG